MNKLCKKTVQSLLAGVIATSITVPALSKDILAAEIDSNDSNTLNKTQEYGDNKTSEALKEGIEEINRDMIGELADYYAAKNKELLEKQLVALQNKKEEIKERNKTIEGVPSNPNSIEGILKLQEDKYLELLEKQLETIQKEYETKLINNSR